MVGTVTVIPDDRARERALVPPFFCTFIPLDNREASLANVTGSLQDPDAKCSVIILFISSSCNYNYNYIYNYFVFYIIIIFTIILYIIL